MPHRHPHQPQGGQANGGGHAPHLAASEAALESRHLQTQVVLESARREALKAQSDAGLTEMAQASPPKDGGERALQALAARILRGESTYQTNTTHMNPIQALLHCAGQCSTDLGIAVFLCDLNSCGYWAWRPNHMLDYLISPNFFIK